MVSVVMSDRYEDVLEFDWDPDYSPWRHGGWYVGGVHYRSGAIGCVSRNYPDKKWRIVCDSRSGGHTYPTRDAAAAAELMLALAEGKPSAF